MRNEAIPVSIYLIVKWREHLLLFMRICASLFAGMANRGNLFAASHVKFFPKGCSVVFARAFLCGGGEKGMVVFIWGVAYFLGDYPEDASTWASEYKNRQQRQGGSLGRVVNVVCKKKMYAAERKKRDRAARAVCRSGACIGAGKRAQGAFFSNLLRRDQAKNR